MEHTDVLGITSKSCTKCLNVKPLSEFNKNNKNKDGFRSECGECQRAVGRKYAAKRRETDSELLNARTKAWFAKQIENNPNFHNDRYWANPERGRRSSKKHYHENKEKCLAAQKLWRKNNPELAHQSAKNWKINHPEENRQISMGVTSRYRAKKKLATIQDFSHHELMQRMSVFGFQCAYCDGPFEEIDHLIPLSKGGKHCLSNLRPSCTQCNSRKSNKMPTVWFEELRKDAK